MQREAFLDGRRIDEADANVPCRHAYHRGVVAVHKAVGAANADFADVFFAAADFGAEMEILELGLGVQNGVPVGRGTADQHALIDAPAGKPLFPTGQILAVEERNETRFHGEGCRGVRPCRDYLVQVLDLDLAELDRRLGDLSQGDMARRQNRRVDQVHRRLAVRLGDQPVPLGDDFEREPLSGGDLRANSSGKGPAFAGVRQGQAAHGHLARQIVGGADHCFIAHDRAVRLEPEVHRAVTWGADARLYAQMKISRLRLLGLQEICSVVDRRTDENTVRYTPIARAGLVRLPPGQVLAVEE